jgi:ABC-2 type transport system permease protein
MTLILKFVLVNCQAIRRCRLNFWIDITIALFKQIFFLLSWKIFFTSYNHVSGWYFKDMLAMYGLLSISIGVVELFFGGIKDLSFFIESGKLDSILLYPNSPVLNIGTSDGTLSSLGDIILGLICLSYSDLFTKNFFIFIFLIPLNILFLFSLYLYINSLGFFIKESSFFLRDLNSKIMIFLTQPASGYKGIIKAISFTIIPVALGNYLPIKFFKTPDLQTGITLIISVLIFFTLSISIFNYGIKKFKHNR